MKPCQLGLGESLSVDYFTVFGYIAILEILMNMDINRIKYLHVHGYNILHPHTHCCLSRSAC